jgi:hypothetical protein
MIDPPIVIGMINNTLRAMIDQIINQVIKKMKSGYK